MEAFSLTCTTCKSRLKVRDAAAIGQIMACPKCGSMVLIKQPAPGSPASASSDAGDTRSDLSGSFRPQVPVAPSFPLNTPINTSAFDDVDELLGNAPPRSMVPVPTARNPAPGVTGHAAPRPAPPIGTQPTIVRSNVSGQNPDSQAKTISQNDIPVSNPPPTSVRTQAPVSKSPESLQKTTAAAIVAAAALPPVPAAAAKPVAAPLPPAATPPGYDPTVVPQDTNPPAPGAANTLAGSRWQWVIVGGSGVLGIGLAIGVVVMTLSWFNSRPSKPIALGPGPSVPVVPNPAQPPVETPITPPEGSPSVPAIPNDVANISPLQPAKVEPVPAVPMPVQPVPAVPNPTVAVPAVPKPETDPLGLTEPPPAAAPLLPADDPLNKFADILGGGNQNPLPAEPQPPEVKPALPTVDAEPEAPPATDALPKPDPLHIDAPARLSDPLPAIEISGTPLIDFLQVMQDLTTIPITLRPDGLSMAKLTPITPETPVTWKGEATTIGEALRAALKPFGLEPRLEADQLVIDVASPQLTPWPLAVKDLTEGDDNRASELASLITTFIAPDSWGEEEGQPSLVVGKDVFQIRQHRLPLAQCILLTEKLRIARGSRPVSKFDAKLFELATRTQLARPALSAPITLNYSQPTSVLRIADRLGKVAKVRILFDWQSLASVGWNPTGEATLTVESQPLSSALDDLTRRMQLAWRVVDARTIQITSPATLAAHVELEVYSVKDLLSPKLAGDDLAARMRSAIGSQHFRDAGGRGELRFEANSNCLLASLTQPQQQQLAKLLTQLRGEVAAK
ncbi:hypothetical protein NA78x_002199 [Anatilimnocola sp. NA78]|uniref:hypothetical protein n=1 Tax=Anatilimnocola sp. NA78 TaxID=3415683 RepID=UPI003CE4CF01